MKLHLIAALAAGTIVAACAPASAQFGGGGNVFSGTGDAQAQNLPSTVGIGRQTGNGYFSWRGPEYPQYDGRSAYPGQYRGSPYRPY